MPLIEQQDVIAVTDAASALAATNLLQAALQDYPECRIVSVSLAINPRSLVSLLAVVETI